MIEEQLTIGGFVPFPSHVLVEPLPPDQKVGTMKLIEVPQAHQEKKALGWVRRLNPNDDGKVFTVGDLVLFADSAGHDVRLEGRDLKILQYVGLEDSEILGWWPVGTVSI